MTEHNHDHDHEGHEHITLVDEQGMKHYTRSY